MKQQKKNHFDRSNLSEYEHQLLMDFHLRREMYNHFLDMSNILYNKVTCPGCGFPTLNQRSDFETCIICLWEDCGIDDKNATLICPPNHQSLIEHRINVGNFIRIFEEKVELELTAEQHIQNIKAFEKDLYQGEQKINSRCFEDNLKQILHL